MTVFNRWLIGTHRYLGIPLSVLFVLWFASGIVMLYTGDMPRLAPQERLARLAPLDLSRVRLTPAAAARRARIGRPPERADLLTVAGRPAYRFDGTTVFADTGARMPPAEPAAAREVAARFSRTPTAAVHPMGLVERPDQWTLVAREALPAYRFRVDDAAGTELYVARRTAEVAMVTTRRTRLLAWLGAIPHWFYLPALRVDRPLWEAVIVWTSAFGCLIAITGLLLGFTRFRWRPSQRREPRIPYAGPMWWHHLTGLVFGVATLTWVFSGLLSVQPFAWMTLPGLAAAAGGARRRTARPRGFSGDRTIRLGAGNGRSYGQGDRTAPHRWRAALRGQARGRRSRCAPPGAPAAGGGYARAAAGDDRRRAAPGTVGRGGARRFGDRRGAAGGL